MGRRTRSPRAKRRETPHCVPGKSSARPGGFIRKLDQKGETRKEPVGRTNLSAKNGGLLVGLGLEGRPYLMTRKVGQSGRASSIGGKT